MSDNLFDNFLKEKLQNHVSPVPGDMWQRIQAKKEKERRGGFWWNNYRNIGLAIVGVAIISALLIIQPFNSGTDVVSNEIQTKSNTGLGTTPLNSEPPKTSSEGTISSDKNQSLANDRSLKHQDDPSVATKQPNDQIADQDKQSSATALKNAHSQVNNHYTKGINHSNLIQPHSTSGSITSRSGKQFAADNFQSGKTNFAKETANAFQANNTENVEHVATTNALEFLASKIAAAKVFQLNKTVESLKGIKLTDCPSAFGNRKSNWYVEGFVSPDYSVKRTSNTGVNEEYIKRKDSTESYNGAFTAGIRLSTTIGEHLLLKSGLQYSQINEKFNYRAENERRLTTVVTIRTIIRGPGDTLTVRDTSIVEQIGYRVKTTYNRYRSFDIPVILGYEWGNDEWRGSINAGVIFNIRSWQQGDMLDTSYIPVAFDKTSSPVFKHNIGIGIYAGAALIKPIGNKLDVFAEPYMRYNISSMTNSGSPFNQKFHIIGINFGIRYKIAGNRQQ
jgi:hypothetical protein